MQVHLRGFAKTQQQNHRVLATYRQRVRRQVLAAGLIRLTQWHRFATAAAWHRWRRVLQADVARMYCVRQRVVARTVVHSWQRWQRLVAHRAELYHRLQWHHADRARQRLRLVVARWRAWATTRRRHLLRALAHLHRSTTHKALTQWKQWLQLRRRARASKAQVLAAWRLVIHIQQRDTMMAAHESGVFKRSALQSWRRNMQLRVNRRQLGFRCLRQFLQRIVFRAWRLLRQSSRCRRHPPTRRRLASCSVYVAFSVTRAQLPGARKLALLLRRRRLQLLRTGWYRWRQRASASQLQDAALFLRLLRNIARLHPPFAATSQWHARRNAQNAQTSWAALIVHFWRFRTAANRPWRRRQALEHQMKTQSHAVAAQKLAYCLAKRDAQQIICRFAQWAATCYLQRRRPRLRSNTAVTRRLAQLKYALRCGKIELCQRYSSLVDFEIEDEGARSRAM
ncbi:hypothetical protein ACHHYP_20212 [Achlya hypogyna]|uniref:Uncharacterized protein n=1 Tax=Achlya hypogyna TaxID=1202772 RepID=A0A1V9YY13_ACHHY|nr:hypothetical protein ACHHYP_20212 [Achlya hypogyna]